MSDKHEIKTHGGRLQSGRPPRDADWWKAYHRRKKQSEWASKSGPVRVRYQDPSKVPNPQDAEVLATERANIAFEKYKRRMASLPRRGTSR